MHSPPALLAPCSTSARTPLSEIPDQTPNNDEATVPDLAGNYSKGFRDVLLSI